MDYQFLFAVLSWIYLGAFGLMVGFFTLVIFGIASSGGSVKKIKIGCLPLVLFIAAVGYLITYYFS